jgi:hypothetical protein
MIHEKKGMLEDELNSELTKEDFNGKEQASGANLQT